MAEFQKIIKERERMCNAHGIRCEGCPLSRIRRKSETICTLFMIKDPEEAEEILMKWAAENPFKTNGAKFREVFGYDFVQAMHADDWYNAEYKEPEEQEEERI